MTTVTDGIGNIWNETDSKNEIKEGTLMHHVRIDGKWINIPNPAGVSATQSADGSFILTDVNTGHKLGLKRGYREEGYPPPAKTPRVSSDDENARYQLTRMDKIALHFTTLMIDKVSHDKLVRYAANMAYEYINRIDNNDT